MMRTALFIAFLSLALSGAARADSACSDRKSIVDKLATEYRETAGGRGFTYKGGILEIFTSREGSWTIIVTKPGAGISLVSCLLAHGESWESLPDQLTKSASSS